MHNTTTAAYRDIEVIIPAYNAADYIVQTLASACAQTYKPKYITVVNDSSSDATAALVQQFAKERAPQGVTVQLRHNTGPRGPSAARNLALREGKTEWVAFLDADDLMLPEQLAALAAALAEHEDAVLSFVDSLLFNADGVVVPSLLVSSGIGSLPATKLSNEVETLGEETFLQLCKTGIFGTSACLFVRAVALEAGAFDESMMYCEDTDLFLRMAVRGKFVFSRKVLSQKRIHGSNLTHPKNKYLFCRGTVYLLAKALGRIRQSSQSAQLLGSATQQACLRMRLHEAVEGYLYHASLGGLSRYRAAADLCRQAGFATAAWHPRHLARLVSSYVRPT